MADPLIDAALAARIAWADAGLRARLAVLQDAGRLLAAQRERLHEGLYGDFLSADLARYYGEWIVHSGDPELLARYAADHGRWVAAADGDGGELLVRRPDGLVLLVVPANSPTINAAPLFSMLLPGNAVLVRAPNNDRGLRFIAEEVIGGALERHGFDRALVTVVTSRSRDFLDRFLDEPRVRTVVFFGNSTAGKSVAERGHHLGKKVILELEGSDHMLVWKDADLPAAIASARHAFDFSTQPCPIPKHFLVHDAVFDDFLAGLLAWVPPCSVTVQADRVHGNLVPVARPEGYFAALDQLRNIATVHCGGHRMDADGCPNPDGAYVAPTVVTLDIAAVVGGDLLCFEDEIFFPLIPVVRFGADDDATARQMADIVQNSPFGLRCSIWCRDPARISEFTREIADVGLLIFNGEHSQCPDYAAPWGGPRRSGGPYGENHLFWLKTSHLQAISCATLDRGQVGAVLAGLGFEDFAARAGFWRPPAEITPAAGDVVKLTVRDRLATLELCRPQRHNAVDIAMRDQLAAHLDTLEALGENVRCVVIRGAGRSFCSGADLTLLQSLSPAESRDFMLSASWTFQRLERLDAPVLAAVDGYCLGGGFELALHCDEVLATDDATFGLPETHMGFVTTAGSVSRLVDAVGTLRAKELLLSGRRVSGTRAATIGLATESAPREAFDALLHRRCAHYLALPAAGVAAMKRLLVEHRDHTPSWIRETRVFEGLIRDKMRGAP